MAKQAQSSLVKRLGRRLAEHRKAAGFTQEQLAEYLDVDTLTVSRYETGNILPPLNMLELIAKLLHIKISDLLDENPINTLEHAERIAILLSGVSASDRDWIESVIKLVVVKCKRRKSTRVQEQPVKTIKTSKKTKK